MEVSGQLNAATPSPHHFKSRERKGAPKPIQMLQKKRKNLLLMPEFRLQVIEPVA